MASRRFTEKEAAALLRKAAEIQGGGSESSAEGISVEELRAAASEIGIGALAFDAAIDAVDQPEGVTRGGFWGGPRAFAQEQLVGGTLSEDAWEEILTDLRRTFGDQGTVNVRGGTREWTATAGGAMTMIFTARQVGGSVRLSASSSLDGLAAIFYIIAFIPMLMGAALVSKFAGAVPALGVVLGLAWIVSAFLITRAIYSKGCRSHVDDWKALMARSTSRVGAAETLEATTPQSTDVRTHLEAH